MVLSPEHPLVEKLTSPDRVAVVEDYCKEAAAKSEMDRTAEDLEKTGVWTGSYAVQSREWRENPHLDCRLCADGLWHRGDYGGAGPRPARL
jgi:leucyl-tRNA synthetase